jgi:hypothetical protein
VEKIKERRETKLSKYFKAVGEKNQMKESKFFVISVTLAHGRK